MANYWSGKGQEVTVATWAGKAVPDFYKLDKSVNRVFIGLYGNFKQEPCVNPIKGTRKLIETSLALKPDVIISFSDATNVVAIACGIITRTPVIAGVRTSISHWLSERPKWRWPIFLAYRMATQVVVQTQACGQWLSRFTKCNPIVIPNSLRDLPDPCPERQNIVICVGRLTREKGHDLAIRAFADISPSFPDWKLFIIGTGPLLGQLNQLATDLGIIDSVVFVGEITDTEQWMAKASLFLMPSRYEGFPNALTEAMAMGAPVISSDCEYGPSDLVLDGKNGILVPPEDYESLARAMRRLMASKRLRCELGNNAMQVRELLDLSHIMSQWEALLAKVLDGKKNRRRNDSGSSGTSFGQPR